MRAGGRGVTEIGDQVVIAGRTGRKLHLQLERQCVSSDLAGCDEDDVAALGHRTENQAQRHFCGLVGGGRGYGEKGIEGELQALARGGDGVIDAGLEGGSQFHRGGPIYATHDSHAVGIVTHGFFKFAGEARGLGLISQLSGLHLLGFGEGKRGQLGAVADGGTQDEVSVLREERGGQHEKHESHV